MLIKWGIKGRDSNLFKILLIKVNFWVMYNVYW